MKFLPLASLTLVASLALTGCASSPSLEEEAKLIEYEKCLAHDAMIQKSIIEVVIAKGDSLDTTKVLEFEASLKDCAKYRP